MRLIFLFGLLMVQLGQAFAQDVAIGEWREHLPYAKTTGVAYANTKVFCITPYSAFYYDLQDNSSGKLSKMNLLSDIGLSRVAYDATSNTVVIGYTNGNVDLIDVNGMSSYNMSDIKRSNIIGDKKIYNIHCENGMAYLSTGFGIVKIDIQRREVSDTYYVGPSGTLLQVNGVVVRGDTIFAATEKGLYRAYKDNPFLSNYASWSKVMSLPNSVRDSSLIELELFNNDLVLAFNSSQYGKDTLYFYNGSTWQKVSAHAGVQINSVESSGGRLVVNEIYGVFELDAAYTNIQNIFQYPSAGIEANHAVYGGGRYWIADNRLGLSGSITPWDNFFIQPDGPRSASCFGLDISDGDVWIAPGLIYGAAWLNDYNIDFLSGRSGGTWQTRADFSDPGNVLSDTLFDLINVAIDPEDPTHVFGGSMSFKGLVEMRAGQIVRYYDETNSNLPSWTGRPGYCGITATRFDEDGNLWMTLAFVDHPLAVLKPDGTMHVYSAGSDLDNKVHARIVCSEETGLKWIAVPKGGSIGGVFVLDDKGTLDDESDDQRLFYKSGSGLGNLPSDDVLSIAEDLDNEIWIGTTAGVVVVYSQEAVFSGGNFDAQQILIEQDGNIQVLLETETVSAIAVDGANRKWIGTQGSGVYLLSEDGTELLYHFTTDNSPLFSNIINDIKIDHLTGEVYFATASGLCSYRGTATIEAEAYDSVYAYPNPVLPTYEGVIAIKGLSRNSDVKITDIAGNIVFVTVSDGGQAIWDGRNLQGEKVKPGVYTALCTSTLGKGKVVAKILIVN
jgi:hypothetical protein